MDDAELIRLLRDPESDRVERKSSASDANDLRQAICAFANDMPGHGRPGVLFIGVRDDGSCADLPVTDELLTRLAHMRDDGLILPMPVLKVERRRLNGCDLAVVIVEPSQAPPVRFRGRVWIRVGPRRATASPEEERILNERRRSGEQPFDIRPVAGASLDDLDFGLFREELLPSAVSEEVMAENRRPVEQQLASLRLATAEESPVPTVVGLLALSDSPRDWIAGAYVQFLRIEGTSLADPIKDAKDLDGPVGALLRRIDELLQVHVSVAVDVTSGSVEVRHPDYPVAALQQLIRNAVLHRNYEGTAAPVRITWFSDRIEIQNPGGPYGQVTVENFGRPGITDYRNPHLAEILRHLGFVQRFGVGLEIARRELEKNGNPPLQLVAEASHVLATVRRRP